MTPRRRLLLVLSGGLNVALGFLLWQLWTWPAPPAPLRLPDRPARVASAPVTTNAPALSPAPTTSGARLHWADLASTNFLAYRDNLRAVGCPEKTVRDILESEINAEFARRRRPLLDQLQSQFWDFAARGMGDDGVEGAGDRFKSLKEERDALIEEVLGGAPPDPAAEETERRERFAEQYDWAPAELRSQLVELDVQGWKEQRRLAEEIAAREDSSWTQVDHARRQQLQAEQAAARTELLGDLAAEFERRRSSAGHWAANAAGFEATEEEWRTVADAKAAWDRAQAANQPRMDAELMRRYGLLPDGVQADQPGETGTPQEQEAARKIREAEIAAAEARYQETLASTLGPERLAEFERAQDDAYQQTRRVTRRLGLDDQSAARAWEIERAARETAKQLRENAAIDAAARDAALREIQAEAERSLRATLGERGLAPYREYAGGWLGELVPQP